MNKFSVRQLPAFITTLLLCAVMASCNADKKKTASASDTLTSGTIQVSVDESFKPVMDEEIKVFEASFPGTKIDVHYKPEADCLKDLFRDSATRMVIVTRGLSNKEEKFFKDSLLYVPRWDELATDAVAVIVNAGSTDTLFTKQRLSQMLAGQSNGKKIIFDGLSATSTVRYAMDSLNGGKPFDTSVVKAAKSSQAVIDYVSENANAIGLVGISWIGNPQDPAQLSMLKKVKIASLKCDTCAGTVYVQPTQYNLMTNRYPLVRGLYYILKENYDGLGSGFLNFLQYERGQLIFRRSYLGPSKIGFAIRTVELTDTLK